jgi:hypothetical protein
MLSFCAASKLHSFSADEACCVLQELCRSKIAGSNMLLSLIRAYVEAPKAVFIIVSAVLHVILLYLMKALLSK